MSWTNYLEKEILDHVFGCGTRDFSPPSDLYVFLSKADPGEDGSAIDEPSGGGYSRVGTDEGDWNAAVTGGDGKGLVDNANLVDFGTASGDWGDITHFGVADDPTAGNVLMSAALTTPKTVQNGDPVRFPTGDLQATLD